MDSCLFQDNGAQDMNQGYVVNVAVCRISTLFAVEIGRCLANKAGDCRKKKDALVVKAGECHRGELTAIPASAIVFQCNTGQVI